MDVLTVSLYTLTRFQPFRGPNGNGIPLYLRKRAMRIAEWAVYYLLPVDISFIAVLFFYVVGKFKGLCYLKQMKLLK